MSDPNIASFGTSQLYEIILAIGGLGTAAYGLVDATKSFGEYGPSQVGFGDIEKAVSELFPKKAGEAARYPAAPSAGTAATDSAATATLSDEAAKFIEAAKVDLLETLHSNWINGMAMTDQKAVAKALIKLRLSPDTAGSMAGATGSNAGILGSIAGKLRPSTALTASDSAKQGADSLLPPLTPRESDELGRFDLALSALLDQGYQRGDQRYRNFAKILAVGFSVLIAAVTTYLTERGFDHYMYFAIIAGLLTLLFGGAGKYSVDAQRKSS